MGPEEDRRGVSVCIRGTFELTDADEAETLGGGTGAAVGRCKSPFSRGLEEDCRGVSACMIGTVGLPEADGVVT